MGRGPGFCEENTTSAPFNSFGLLRNSVGMSRFLGYLFDRFAEIADIGNVSITDMLEL